MSRKSIHFLPRSPPHRGESEGGREGGEGREGGREGIGAKPCNQLMMYKIQCCCALAGTSIMLRYSTCTRISCGTSPTANGSPAETAGSNRKR